ncbi:MAG: phage major capsid protein, partial [Patulibacter sp.]
RIDRRCSRLAVVTRPLAAQTTLFPARNHFLGSSCASYLRKSGLIITNHLRPIQVPRLDTDATATAGVEGSPATDANTVGSSVTLAAHRVDGVFTCSLELLLASEYNLESLLATFAQRAIQAKVSAYLSTGAGGGTAPQGAFTAAAVTVGETAASQTAITVDEWVNLMKSIPKGARKGARIVASDVAHTELLKAKTGMGDYLLDTVDGGGYSFAGSPLFTEPQADQGGMTTGEVHVVAGDWSSFFVRMTPFYFKRTDGDDPLNPKFTFCLWMDSAVVGPDLRSLDMA